jgi:hypothetical protein
VPKQSKKKKTKSGPMIQNLSTICVALTEREKGGGGGNKKKNGKKKIPT